MTRDEFERLIRVETKLEVVEERLINLKDDNETRLNELRDMLVALSAPPPPSPPPTVWTFLASNWKPLAVLLGLVTGATSVVEALKLLP